MRKQNKFWNGKIIGVCGAAIQLSSACLNYVLDRLTSYFTRQNLYSAGKGVVIQRGFVIRYPSNIQLGDYVHVGRGVNMNSELASGKLTVGTGTWIGRKCHLDFTGNLVIGHDCTLSENVRIITHSHGLLPRSGAEGKALTIGDRVWIGSNVIILHTVSAIGDNSIIGAGSVVTKSIPPGVIVAGNPGRVISDITNTTSSAAGK